MQIELPELGQVQARLSLDQGRRLAESDIVTAAPSPYASGVWDVASRGKVGVARVGELELWIAPKLAIDRLLFLVGYATNPRGWRDDVVGLNTRYGLIPALAEALWRQTERAVRQGILHGYREIEESSYVLRGRLRETDQLRKHFGQALPMEIRHDDFTVDIAENQILLAAVTRMLTVPRISDDARTRLTALRRRLAKVTTLPGGSMLPAWQPTRLNERYHVALRLAEIVWRATSPEDRPGSMHANGFLFDMWKIFEDFATTAVSEALQARHGGSAATTDFCYLDEGHAVEMRPDLVWRVAGRPAAVLDAKYKQERPAGYPNADIYQVLAYCTALRLPRGHLVYAKGGAEPARHVVRHGGVEIVCHALDLSAPPAQVLAQIDDLADDLSREVEAA